MSNEPFKRATYIRHIKLLLVAVALAAPAVMYVFTFGMTITDSHTRWAEMGSAMSGLYTPIFSLLTLAVLIAQVRSQNQINTHQFDQSYILDARGDLEFYLAQLEKELSKELDQGTSVHQALNSAFAYAALADLRSDDVLEIAKNLNRRFPKVFGTWSAMYSIFAGLGSQSRIPYSNNFVAAKQKVVSIVSYESCVALDNYIWCVSEGNLKYPYEFGQELPSHRKP